VTSDEEDAARLAGGVWAAVNLAGGPGAPAFRHCPAVFDPAWLAGLRIPAPAALPPGRTAAMPDPAGRAFERHAGAGALAAAYQRMPRTRMIDDIGWGDGTPWAALAGRHLTRLAGAGPRIIITVYQSAAGDQELGTHQDAWTSAIVQADGAKTWETGHALIRPGDAGRQVTITAGDILIVPRNLPHLVTTPPDPGRSTHLVFAINRDPAGGP